MELTITKEKVLEAASKCRTARETLEVLFPEVFQKEINVSNVKYSENTNNGEKMFRYNGDAIIWTNSVIDFKGFGLSRDFDWKIVKEEGYIRLYPTRKDD